ncbi:Ig-like domain-containing protein [Ekhidna sp.]|uniref:Ig-like domain-containing protein n=1 Tax=Ekhidna sp. TaxID=2608089 RepID=UPI003C7B6DCD
MKYVLRLIIITLLSTTAFYKCANPGRPTGGPKDTIPPVLINAIPVSGTTNFKDQLIELEFSEYINADKIQQELIITPKTDIRYKSIVKRNKLVLKLDEALEDSTTYYFNFANGVTDITEKNPVVNLALAFSTGPFIDSMSVSGSVEELMTQEPGAGYVVSLYPYSDTLDYFADSPMYFTTANDSGNYTLNYIKQGKYKIISFNDDNNNFMLDPETEAHGFISDTIQLDSALALPKMRSVLQNVKPIQLINTRPTGRYVEIKFNKQVDNYTLTPEYLPHNLIGENNDIIRLYKPEQLNYKDSLTSYITASDSLGNQIVDTLKYVFLESNRKPSGFSYSVPSKIEIKNNPLFAIKFNKPIKSLNADSIIIQADSIFSFYPPVELEWNTNRTELNLRLQIDKDSLLQAFEASIPKDTAASDSTQKNQQRTGQRNLEIVMKKNMFLSVENDTSSLKTIILQKPQSKPSGTLQLAIQTEKKSFTIQLTDKSGKVKYQRKNEKNLNFTSIKPDTYQIRVLIDSNEDGKWSYGNLLENKQPEDVFLYPEEISIRENWVVEMSISF